MAPSNNRSRYNSWTIIGLHPLCALIFTTGYALREYGAYNYIYTTDTPQQTMTIYIMSQVFINICPYVRHPHTHPKRN